MKHIYSKDLGPGFYGIKTMLEGKYVPGTDTDRVVFLKKAKIWSGSRDTPIYQPFLIPTLVKRIPSLIPASIKNRPISPAVSVPIGVGTHACYQRFKCT